MDRNFRCALNVLALAHRVTVSRLLCDLAREHVERENPDLLLAQSEPEPDLDISFW
jgi:hypothetical protein